MKMVFDFLSSSKFTFFNKHDKDKLPHCEAQYSLITILQSIINEETVSPLNILRLWHGSKQTKLFLYKFPLILQMTDY